MGEITRALNSVTIDRSLGKIHNMLYNKTCCDKRSDNDAASAVYRVIEYGGNRSLLDLQRIVAPVLAALLINIIVDEVIHENKI